MRTLIPLILVLTIAAPAAGQSPEAEFQRALRLERTQGDYAGAISIYETVIADASDRPLRGRAMMQLAGAYENLGRAEAARMYQRVLADFADMDELVTEARAGYARTREPVEESAAPEPLSRRRVEVGQDLESWGSAVSPSGRYVIGASYEPPGVRYIEIATGDMTLIPIDPGTEGYAEYPRFSPDESKIALGWYPENAERKQDLILIDVETGEFDTLVRFQDYYGERLASDFVRGGIHPHDWTADGSEILVYTHASTNPTGGCCGEGWIEDLLMVPVSGADPRLITTLQPGTFSWENACLSADERYAFVDTFIRRSSETNLDYVSRIDLSSGDVVPWRKSDGVDHFLHACTASGSVLYSAMTLGSKLLKVAESQDLNGLDDEWLTRLSPDDYTSLGSKAGDIQVWQGGSARGLYLVEVDTQSGALKSSGKLIIEEGIFGLGWSPSGDRLAWVDGSVRDQIKIWNSGDESVRLFPVGSRPNGMHWIDESTIGFYQFQSNVDPPGPQNWDSYSLHLDTGEVTLHVRAADMNRIGMKERNRMKRGVSLAWDEDNDCLYRVQQPSLEKEIFRCFERDYVAPREGWTGVVVTATLARDRLIFRGHRGDGKVEFGLLSMDGADLNIVHVDDQSRGAVTWSRPGRAGEVLIARAAATGARAESIDRLDLETGELMPMFGELFAHMTPLDIQLRPGGGQLAVFGMAKRDDSEESHVMIVQNVLGGK